MLIRKESGAGSKDLKAWKKGGLADSFGKVLEWVLGDMLSMGPMRIGMTQMSQMTLEDERMLCKFYQLMANGMI